MVKLIIPDYFTYELTRVLAKITHFYSNDICKAYYVDIGIYRIDVRIFKDKTMNEIVHYNTDTRNRDIYGNYRKNEVYDSYHFIETLTA